MDRFFTYPADTPASDLRNDRDNKTYIEDTLAAEAAEPASEEAAEADEAPVIAPGANTYGSN